MSLKKRVLLFIVGVFIATALGDCIIAKCYPEAKAGIVKTFIKKVSEEVL